MGRLVGLLRSRGLRQGVIGGNRRWLMIWAVVMTGQIARRVFRSKPVVAKYELKPGETITISDLGVAEAEL